MSIRTSFFPFGAGGSADNTFAGLIKNHPHVVNGEPDYHTEEDGWHIYKFNTGLGDTWCYRGDGDNYFRFSPGTTIFRIVRVNENGSVRMTQRAVFYRWSEQHRYTIPRYWKKGFNADGVSGVTVKQAHYNEFNTLGLNNNPLLVDSPFYYDVSRTNNRFNCYRRTLGGGTPILYDSSWEPWTVANGKLEYPVGMLTPDEIVIMGYVPWGTTPNTAFYYSGNGSNDRWFFTPEEDVWNNECSCYIFRYPTAQEIQRSGGNQSWVNPRVVINVRGDIEVTGLGTLSDPYIPKE